MRNGVVAGMADSLSGALRLTVEQAIVTHADPLSVLCCAAQTWLLATGRDVAKSQLLAPGGFLPHFLAFWGSWLGGAGAERVREWASAVSDAMPDAARTLAGAAYRPGEFDPFAVEFAGRDGYSLLTLQIALWAAAASLGAGDVRLPAWIPGHLRALEGPHVLAWVALVGHDADTYGAAAGPLLFHLHSEIPGCFTRGLTYSALLR